MRYFVPGEENGRVGEKLASESCEILGLDRVPKRLTRGGGSRVCDPA